ncbi:MAG: hypothetical protein QW271_04560 [Sulfolobales archaeon]
MSRNELDELDEGDLKIPFLALGFVGFPRVGHHGFPEPPPHGLP